MAPQTRPPISRRFLSLLVISLILFSSWACALDWVIKNMFTGYGENDEQRWYRFLAEDDGSDYGDDAEYPGSGQEGYLADETSAPAHSGDGSTSGGSGDLKPVGFVNYGEFDAVVMPYTYIPLGATAQAAADQTSTVSSANDGVGDWPNPSRFLSLPMGTYSWCIDWEEGDLNEDGQIDYFHYIQNDPTLLDENDSDELDFAEEVAISAPPSSGVIYEGRCQPAELVSSCPPDGKISVNVFSSYALEEEDKPQVYAIPNTAEQTPPDGIEISFGGTASGWGNNIILWSEGDFAQAATSHAYTAAGVQIHGDQTIGWARVLFDGQEVWRGDTSTYTIAEGRYGVYVEVRCFPPGSHLIRVEGLGINGSGGGSSIPVSYFGFRD